jgi:hypothetical protein
MITELVFSGMFGKLDEKEAKLLFQLITKRIEEQLKKKNKN